MVVKIIKPGVRPETRVIELECRNCGCEFTFSPMDAERVSDQRDGDYFSIFCPTCGKACTRSTRL